VVVGIIAILAALLLVAVVKVRETANRVACASNLRQLAQAVHAYHITHGQLPYSQVGGEFGWGPDSRAWSFWARLLPYVEQDKLYTQGRIETRTLRESGIADAVIPLLRCPSDPSIRTTTRTDRGNLKGFAVGVTNYKGVSGSNWGFDQSQKMNIPTQWKNIGTNGTYDGLEQGDGIFYRTDYQRPLRWSDIGNPLSTTFMIGEDLPDQCLWVSWAYANKPFGTCAIPPNARRPDGTECPLWDWYNRQGFRSGHRGGVQFANGDGSVQFIANTIDLSVYRARGPIQPPEPASSP
jgi:type II secretory pathway pseudopilin PulG